MNPKEARNAVLQRYLDTFGGLFPIALQNQPFSPPEPAAGVKWVRIDVRLGYGEQDTLGRTGGRRFVQGGAVTVQVFTPNGGATDGNDELVKQSLDLLDGVRIGDSLWTYGGRIVTVGTDGEWFQQSAILNLRFEETR
jgi:hypothetical protein